MRKIYKYELRQAETLLELPVGAKPLHVGIHKDDHGKQIVCVWIMVDVDATRKRGAELTIVGTGNPIADESELGDYVGTTQQYDFVWHIFFKTVY